jgi:hypothetical protein
MTWTDDELERVGDAEELQLASRRPDGTLRKFITMWVVRDDGELYVRSAYGPDNPWYRRAMSSGEGRIRAGGIERDAVFEHVAENSPVHAALDDVYREKYRSHGARIVNSVAGEHVHGLTIRLVATNSD